MRWWLACGRDVCRIFCPRDLRSVPGAAFESDRLALNRVSLLLCSYRLSGQRPWSLVLLFVPPPLLFLSLVKRRKLPDNITCPRRWAHANPLLEARRARRPLVLQTTMRYWRWTNRLVKMRLRCAYSVFEVSDRHSLSIVYRTACSVLLDGWP